MGSQAVAETAIEIRAAQRQRIRALIVPREHGAWGLLFVPLLTGTAVGIASMVSAWPLLWFSLAAFSLFWLRTPVESLLGTTPLRAETKHERRTTLFASLTFGAIATSALIALFWQGRNQGLLLIGVVGAAAFVAQAVLKKISRKLRMAAQVVGAIGLTCTAPGAYYVATGRLDSVAWLLWAANWAFAGDQIHFVQLRIHAARAATFAEKFARGRTFFHAQMTLLVVLCALAGRHVITILVLLAFFPALFRGFAWFFRGQQPLQVRNLGWSEMLQGVMFGTLLSTALILS